MPCGIRPLAIRRTALWWFQNMTSDAATVQIIPRILSRKSSVGVLLLCAQFFFGLPAAAQGQQAEQIEWHDEGSFTKADRNAIPALAKIMGLQNPKRVYQGQYLPDLCPYAMVDPPIQKAGISEPIFN